MLHITLLQLESEEEILFLCMCSRNYIIITVIINIIVYIVVVVCQNRQVNVPNKCKLEISASLLYPFLSSFATQSYIQIHT